MTTAEKIRIRRLQLGLTTQKIADACGVNKSTVSRWETGYTGKINLGMLMILAKVLYLEPIQLLSDDEPTINTASTLIDQIVVKINRLSKDDLVKLNDLIDLMFKK